LDAAVGRARGIDGVVAAAAAGNFVPRGFVFEDFDNVDGGVLVDTHFIDTVAVVDVGVVEPGTVAGFPFGSAEHAELGCATAVVAFVSIILSPLTALGVLKGVNVR
jgi:hypothetical protein